MAGALFVTKTLIQVEMPSGGPGYRSVADNEGFAISPGGATLSKMLELVADVPDLSVL